jgi:olefin beta-lactone synthetase
MSNTNLAATLHARAAAHPGRAAIVETSPSGHDRVWSYGELAATAARIAAALRARELRPGDAVLVLQPMSGELYAFLVGAWQAGLVCLFIDPSQGRAHLTACCRRWRPRALFGVSAAHWFSFLIPELRRDVVRLRTSGWAPFTTSWSSLLTTANSPTSPAADISLADADTPALVTFTSGSTGQPKAIVRTHGFLHAQHAAIAEAIALRDAETDLTTLPIFLLANLGTGLTSIIPTGNISRPGTIAPDPIAAQLARHPRVSRGGASPAFWMRLAATPAGRTTLARLRTLYTGGGPLWPDELAALRSASPTTTVICVYGSTEAEPIAEIAAAEALAAPEAGRLLPGGYIRPEIRCAVLRDRWGSDRAALTIEAFAAERCATGEIGEIVVSGAHVVSGYLGGEGDHETKFRVAGHIWHRTGDAGLLDAQGRLWLAGRCAARVTHANRSLYPAEVEVPLRTIPSLRRSALLEVNGSALLVLEAASAAVEAAARAQLALLGLADLPIRLIARLPLDKRHNAKIDYTALRRLLASPASLRACNPGSILS